MMRIDKIIKAWKDSAALNDHINLFGPWSETVFLTKSGDLGVVLRVPELTTRVSITQARSTQSSASNLR